MDATRDASRWETCDAALVAELLQALRTLGPVAFGHATILQARRLPLPFYENHQLVDLMLHGVDGVVRALLLHSPNDTHWLDGQSRPIHAVNALESIALDASTLLDYVRFFLYAMRGEHGAFILLESAEQITLADAPAAAGDASRDAAEVAPGADELAAIRARWVPLHLLDPGEDGRLRARGTVAYTDGIYAATFAVRPDGEIEMVDDEPIAHLTGFAVPRAMELVRQPAEPEPVASAAVPTLQQRLAAHAQASAPPAAVKPAALDDRGVTEAAVSALLAEAARAVLGHRLLQRFNTQSQLAGPIGQLARFVQEFAPIIVIESDIPFIEDIVVGLLDPERQAFPAELIQHAGAVSGDDSRCFVDVRTPRTALHLISFHAYRSLWDPEWTAHQLAISPAAVMIGCERVADVPEALRRVTDLVLTLPRIDERLFVQIFEQVMGVAPPPAWSTGGGDWVRYLLHADFHAPLRLVLSPTEAVDYLRERAQARLAQVSPANSPLLEDLHGLGEARQVADDLVADIAAARAGRIPWSAVDRGVLLVGAPGTGKTTLARALAQACGIKFIHVSAAQWQAAGGLDLHLRAIRSTFSEARRYAPAILFIDEIDSLGNREQFTGSNAIYQTDVVNAVLEQMQGLDEDEPLIVIGATNYPDNVDPALRRAGRLDQVITLPRPNVAGLEHIFSYYLGPHRAAKNLARNVKVEPLAQLAFGLTGADVEFFVRGAARRARKARRRITQADLVAEITRRPRRPDSVVSLTADDMHRVAVHEAGHAIAALLSANGGREVTYVSIIPRMDGSLGFTATAPAPGVVLTRIDVHERLRTILAGRAAEEVVFGKANVSLSAGGTEQSDLAVATRLATRVICTSGFGGDGSLLWTPAPTPAQLDQVDALLRDSYRAAIDLLRDQRAALDRIVRALVDRQEIDGASVRALLADGDK